MTPSPSTRSLLLHDGELADVRSLLASLDVPFVERIGAENDDDRGRPWDLVIASARRLLELQLPNSSAPPTQIAILEHDARTLRSSLRRTGTTLMVCRPVHPAALRALVVHALYRGPEKRRSARVNVGAPVAMKLGWRTRSALLVDLSVSGCRLLTDRALDCGAAFRLQIPAALAGGRAFAVDAHVLESAIGRDPGPHPGPNRFVTTATFDTHSRVLGQLQAAVAAHAEGPTTCREGSDVAAQSARSGARACPAELPVAIDVELSELAAGAPAEPEATPLDEEAARVLVGRDLTRAGMRVDPNPRLEVGMKLELAVHAETRERPLVLYAVVERDDGARGLALRFHDLSPELSRYLDYVIHALPLVIDDDDDEGCLVTELLEVA